MVFISTLVVQLVIAFFHSQIVHAVHAGVWFHAGVLPAVVQSTLDQLGVGRVLGHGEIGRYGVMDEMGLVIIGRDLAMKGRSCLWYLIMMF